MFLDQDLIKIQQKLNKPILNILISDIELCDLFNYLSNKYNLAIYCTSSGERYRVNRYIPNAIPLSYINECNCISNVDILISDNKLFTNNFLKKLNIKYLYLNYPINNINGYQKCQSLHYGWYKNNTINELTDEINNNLTNNTNDNFISNIKLNVLNIVPTVVKYSNLNKLEIHEENNLINSILDNNKLTKTIDLILPTFNNENYTISCLESINTNAKKNQHINIVWVDNNSTEQSKILVEQCIQNLNNLTFTKIFLNKNVGFIKAVNIGLKYLLEKNNSKFIGILNNDIEVSKNWLSELIKTLKSDKKNVCAGSIQYRGDKSNGYINFDDLKWSDELKELNASTFLMTQKNISNLKFITSYLSFDSSNFNDYKFEDHYVPYCAVLFKPFIFKEIGLLNENFHLGYSDDTEFNFRITKAGYKIVKCFKSLVFHNSRSTFKTIFNDNNSFISKIQIANRLQLKISKILNNDNKKKYVIYTAIIGNYDKLKTLTYYDHNTYDYVCFTDSAEIINSQNKDWIIFDISLIKNILNVDNVKTARYFKTHPHLFFENYEKSIWIDGNIDIIKNIDDYVNLLNNDNYILCYNHPCRNCIYQEIAACNSFKKDTIENLNNVKNFLINENYPKNNELIQSNILVRNHNNECIFLMEKWWEMIKNYSKRDQLSFNYIFWKYGGKYLTIPSNFVLNNYYSVIIGVHK